jgi:hypothetical protein
VLPACRWAAAFALLAALAITPHPPARRAVIYIQPGSVSRDRQARLCLRYCDEHDLSFVAVTGEIADAVAAIAGGRVDVIVTAFAGRSRPGDLREVAASAGVEVEYVRAPVPRREMAEAVVTVWRNTGRNVDEAARLLGLTSRNVRAALERLGIYPNGGSHRGRNGKAPDSRE